MDHLIKDESTGATWCGDAPTARTGVVKVSEAGGIVCSKCLDMLRNSIAPLARSAHEFDLNAARQVNVRPTVGLKFQMRDGEQYEIMDVNELYIEFRDAGNALHRWSHCAWPPASTYTGHEALDS